MIAVNTDGVLRALQYGLNGVIGLLGVLFGIWVGGRREKKQKQVRLRNLSYLLMHEVYTETQHAREAIPNLNEAQKTVEQGGNPILLGLQSNKTETALSKNLGSVDSLDPGTLSALLFFHDTLLFANSAETDMAKAYQELIMKPEAQQQQALIYNIEHSIECKSKVVDLGDVLVHRMCRLELFSRPGDKEGLEPDWYNTEKQLMH